MRVVVAVMLALYPLLVYYGIGLFEPKWLAVLLCILALVRAAASRQRFWLAAALGALLLAVSSMLSNQLFPLKLYPVLVNSVLFIVFFASLIHPPSMIERIARLREPNFPPEAVAYTRRVTQVWCVFFVFNGVAAFATAWWGSDAVWALYNGLIAYGLIGILLAAEWLIRRRLKARTSHG